MSFPTIPAKGAGALHADSSTTLTAAGGSMNASIMAPSEATVNRNVQNFLIANGISEETAEQFTADSLLENAREMDAEQQAPQKPAQPQQDTVAASIEEDVPRQVTPVQTQQQVTTPSRIEKDVARPVTPEQQMTPDTTKAVQKIAPETSKAVQKTTPDTPKASQKKITTPNAPKKAQKTIPDALKAAQNATSDASKAVQKTVPDISEEDLADLRELQREANLNQRRRSSDKSSQAFNAVQKTIPDASEEDDAVLREAQRQANLNQRRRSSETTTETKNSSASQFGPNDAVPYALLPSFKKYKGAASVKKASKTVVDGDEDGDEDGDDNAPSTKKRSRPAVDDDDDTAPSKKKRSKAVNDDDEDCVDYAPSTNSRRTRKDSVISEDKPKTKPSQSKEKRSKTTQVQAPVVQVRDKSWDGPATPFADLLWTYGPPAKTLARLDAFPLANLQPTEGESMCTWPTPKYVAFLEGHLEYVSFRLASCVVSMTEVEEHVGAKAIAQFAVDFLGPGIWRAALAFYIKQQPDEYDTWQSREMSIADVVHHLRGGDKKATRGELFEESEKLRLLARDIGMEYGVLGALSWSEKRAAATAGHDDEAEQEEAGEDAEGEEVKYIFEFDD